MLNKIRQNHTQIIIFSRLATAKLHNMPPKSAKRKEPPSTPSEPAAKKPSANGTAFDHSRAAETQGIVDRNFYPPEMSNERCAAYNNNEIPRPLAVLNKTLEETSGARKKIKPGSAVVHWFKRDLRMRDNRGLSLASAKAKAAGVPLVCVFLVSPQDYQAHVTSAVRVDFELRTLEVLKSDLAALDVPLHVETVLKRRAVPKRLLELCGTWGAQHVFCNIEYEVDELRREEKLVQQGLERSIDFTPVHDDVVVPPGALASGAGKQYSVYSPWYRSWVAHIHSDPSLLDEYEAPTLNAKTARERFEDIFSASIPSTPKVKSLTEEEKTRFHKLWPAGEHEAQERLDKFLKERVRGYADARNLPADNATSVLSVHFSTGTLAARTAVREARDANGSRNLDGGNKGTITWISEVAWRDFYKHILVHWPYVCMSKPWKFEYSDIEWEYNEEHFERWCEGKTGFPIVDAAMRQLNHTGYA